MIILLAASRSMDSDKPKEPLVRIIAFTLLLFSLVSCLDSATTPSPPTPPVDESVVELKIPLFVLDMKEVDLGQRVHVDASAFSELAGNVIGWVFERGDNANVYSPVDDLISIEQRQLTSVTFTPERGGFYRISWQTTEDEEVTYLYVIDDDFGPLPSTSINLEFPDNRYRVCAQYPCTSLIDVGEVVDVSLELPVQTTRISLTYRYDDEWLDLSDQLVDGKLSLPITEPGWYDMKAQVYVDTPTPNGHGYVEDRRWFNVRARNNALPTTSFFVKGYEAMQASSHYHFDDATETYTPIINYYAEETVADDSCTSLGYEDFLVDRYQNNFDTQKVFPTFPVNSSLTFDASNSQDADGDELMFLWTLLYFQPENTDWLRFDKQTRFYDQTTSMLTHTFTEAGDYIVDLCVKEADDRVVITGYTSVMYALKHCPYDPCAQVQIKVIE